MTFDESFHDNYEKNFVLILRELYEALFLGFGFIYLIHLGLFFIVFSFVYSFRDKLKSFLPWVLSFSKEFFM